MPPSSRLRDSFINSFPHESTFESSRFRNCCGCHVRKCAFIIGWLEILALTASVLATGLAYGLLWQKSNGELLPLTHHASLSLIGALVSFMIGTVAISLLFCGLAKEKPSLLIPHMIIQFLAIIGLLVTVVTFLYVAAVSAENKISRVAQREVNKNETATVDTTEPSHQPRSSDHWPHIGSGKMFLYSVLISSLCSLASILEIYFLVSIYRTYAYFCAKRDQMKNANVPVKLWTMQWDFRRSVMEDPRNAERVWAEA